MKQSSILVVSENRFHFSKKKKKKEEDVKNVVLVVLWPWICVREKKGNMIFR